MKKIFIISFIILVVDIISKRLIISSMIERESINIINNFFSITYARNTGVAFSFLDGYVDLIVIVTLIIIVMMFMYIKNNIRNNIEVVSYSLVIGGAVGNLLDRIIYGYVVDFLDFNIFGYKAPIFNLADTFIVIGVMMLIIFSRENGGKNEVNSRK